MKEKRKKRMSSAQDKGNGGSHWGPGYWNEMHKWAESLPVERETSDFVLGQRVQRFYRFIQDLPCQDTCRVKAIELTRTRHLIPHPRYFSSRSAASTYIWRFHNKVRQTLSQPRISWNTYTKVRSVPLTADIAQVGLEGFQQHDDPATPNSGSDSNTSGWMWMIHVIISSLIVGFIAADAYSHGASMPEVAGIGVVGGVLFALVGAFFSHTGGF